MNHSRKQFPIVAATMTLGMLLGCGRADAERVPARRMTPFSVRYLSVAEQVRIEEAANVLWTGVAPNQSWEDAVTKLFSACGGTFRVDEAFLLGSYHPRAVAASTWRSELEAAIRPRCRGVWNPSPDPVCKLIQEALRPAPTSVERQSRGAEAAPEGSYSDSPFPAAPAKHIHSAPERAERTSVAGRVADR